MKRCGLNLAHSRAGLIDSIERISKMYPFSLFIKKPVRMSDWLFRMIVAYRVLLAAISLATLSASVFSWSWR